MIPDHVAPSRRSDLTLELAPDTEDVFCESDMKTLLIAIIPAAVVLGLIHFIKARRH